MKITLTKNFSIKSKWEDFFRHTSKSQKNENFKKSTETSVFSFYHHRLAGLICNSLNVSSIYGNKLASFQNTPGTAQVGAIFRAQKDSKTTFSTTGDNKSSQKTKIEKIKFSVFLKFFSKFPVSRIVPKNVKGGTLFISC